MCTLAPQWSRGCNTGFFIFFLFWGTTNRDRPSKIFKHVCWEETATAAGWKQFDESGGWDHHSRKLKHNSLGRPWRMTNKKRNNQYIMVFPLPQHSFYLFWDFVQKDNSVRRRSLKNAALLGFTYCLSELYRPIINASISYYNKYASVKGKLIKNWLNVPFLTVSTLICSCHRTKKTNCGK